MGLDPDGSTSLDARLRARAIGRDWIARIGEPRPLHYPTASADALADLDLPRHVRAGSGLCRWGDRLVIVQDDVHALALVEFPEPGRPEAVVRALPLPAGPDGRRQFGDARGNKAAKLDLEACVVLPDGRLVALGSGSTAARERIIVVDPSERVRVVDGGALFALLRQRTEFSGSELNLEGAVVVDDRLLLFQRGNGAPVVDGLGPSNAFGELSVAEFARWLDDEGPSPHLRSVRRVELGDVRGVPFGFTDAAALPDGRVLFLAGAEDSLDSYHDGEVLGARIGLLDADQPVLADIVDARGQPTPLKLEGLEFVGLGAEGGLELLAVADMDDPDLPAVLVTLSWGPQNSAER